MIRSKKERKKDRLRMTHCPPKSCMPSRANTTMKRKRRKSKLMMDFMEFSRDTTRFLRDAQYLKDRQAGSQTGRKGRQRGGRQAGRQRDNMEAEQMTERERDKDRQGQTDRKSETDR